MRVKVLLRITGTTVWKPFSAGRCLQYKLAWFLSEERKEQILNIRRIIEKCGEFNVLAVWRFIDYAKAFDWVKWKRLYEVLHEMGVPIHLLDMVKSLCGRNKMVMYRNVSDRDLHPFGSLNLVKPQKCHSSLVTFIRPVLKCYVIWAHFWPPVSGGSRQKRKIAGDHFYVTFCVE